MKIYSIQPIKTSFFIFCLALFSSNLYSQDDAKFNEILETLNKTKKGSQTGMGGGISNGIGGEEGYKSFVQNEMQSIFKQLDALSETDRVEITFQEINSQRIELATQLCTKDQRACFLIDEYRSYKSQEAMPERIEDLKIFGHDIFSGYGNDFNFYDSLPLRSDYVIKLGDKIKVQTFGGFVTDEILEVDMTGSIVIPALGSFAVAGLAFEDVSSLIENKFNETFVGTDVMVSFSKVRSKEIFALGNVKSPGTYALNTFGTALNALISSGGVKNNSSLRTIRIVRGNTTVATIDLYDLLIDGDLTSADSVLEDGDAIVVGGLSSSVSIIGEIIRPAIYEISEDDSLEDLMKFALGVTPFADESNISVERILSSGETTIIKPKNISKLKLQNGDRVVVNSSIGQKINSILLSGTIRNAGEYSQGDIQTLGQLINLKSDLLNNTYTGFAVVKRLNFSSKSFRLLNFSLSDQATLDSFNLYSGDEIYIFSKEDIEYSQSTEVNNYLKSNNEKLYGVKRVSEGLEEMAASLLEDDSLVNVNPITNQCLNSLEVLTQNPISNLMRAKLKLFPTEKIRKCTSTFLANPELLPVLLVHSIPVSGNVRFPGLYPSSSDLNAMDLFNLAGGFLLSKLSKEPVFEVGVRSRGFIPLNFDSLKVTKDLTMLSLPLDKKLLPGGYIRLVGEFINPGIYPISDGSLLSELYERSGGLTSYAYPLGGILTRNSIKDVESQALERAKAELSEILASAVASGYLKQNSTDLIGLISMMTNMSNAESVGRLVAELNPTQIRTTPALDLTLEDGDVIYMPKMQNTVTIVGQVLNPVTVPHNVGASFKSYIKQAGGLKKEADKSKIYAVLPNGISSRQQRGITIPVLPFMPFDRSDILPGSTIIVPRQARPLDSLALVETVTPILANLSVTAASIAAITDN
jgi:protein involved in polysaccharide export with SLBB domain